MPYNPANPVVLRVELKINGTWTDVTARGRKASCQIQHGRTPSATRFEGARLDLEIGNADGYLTEGNPVSPWHPYVGRGCPIRVSIVGVLASAVERFSGKIDTLEAIYPGGTDSSMSITALGTLRQIGQDVDVLRSAPYRYLSQYTSPQPDACWPLEDGDQATYAQPLFGAYPMQPFVGTHPSGAVVTWPQWGHGTLAWWLPPVISRSSSSGLTILWGKVNQAAFTDKWIVELAYASTTDAPYNAIDINPLYLGGTATWPQLIFNGAAAGGGEIQVAFNGLPEVDVPTPGLFDGNVHSVRLKAVQSGGDVVWTVYVDGRQLQSGTVTTYTLPAITRIAHVAESGSGSLAIGYLSVWSTEVDFAAYHQAVTGFAGELDGDRIYRLLVEQGWSPATFPSGTVRMGPQHPAELSELLAESELAGQGLLHDSAPDGEVDYVPVSDLQNLTAQLTISKGSLEPDVRPVWDTELVRNDVTSSRPSGGSAHVSDEAHVVLVNQRKRDSPTVAVERDSQLADDAGFRVRTGTAPGPRYPTLGINLRNVDGALLADTVLAHGIGDRITVAAAALPAQHPPGGADVLTVGWTEILDADQWLFRPNVVPYLPYEVFKIADLTRGRAETDGSALVSAATATATSLTVVNTVADGQPWITTLGRPGDFPLEHNIAGEQVRTTAIASVARDGYGRTVAAGSLGTSDTGQTYTLIGTAADFSVTTVPAGHAEISPSATGSDRIGHLLSDAGADRVIEVDVYLPALPASGTYRIGGIARLLDSNNFLGAELLVASSGAATLRINNRIVGVQGVVGSAVIGTLAVNTDYTIRIAAIGSDLAAAAWITSTGRFRAWQVRATSSALLAGTRAGIFARDESAATGHIFAFDRFEVISPQTFTVVRSINGVSKTQSAGNPVGLWRPTAIAL